MSGGILLIEVAVLLLLLLVQRVKRQQREVRDILTFVYLQLVQQPTV